MNDVRCALLSLLLVLAGASVGCKSKTVDRADAGPAKAPEQARPQPLDLDPPARRLAVPMEVLAMRLSDERVGQLSEADDPEGRPLRGIGFNRCQTGWMLQGFVPGDDGKLGATPPFQIPLAQIPTGRAITYTEPSIENRKIVFAFDEASLERVTGEFSITDTAGTPLTKMRFDATPVTVAPSAGVGGQGCFTTGYFQMEVDGQKVAGPVTGVFDGRKLYYVSMQLSERHALSLWAVLDPRERAVGNLIRGDLARVVDSPKSFPFRVVFETRTNKEPIGDAFEGNQLVTDEEPATSGTLHASFLKNGPRGPIRVHLEDLEFPDWDGPLAGRKIEQVRAEAFFATEEGHVPVPTKPDWLERVPQ